MQFRQLAVHLWWRYKNRALASKRFGKCQSRTDHIIGRNNFDFRRHLVSKPDPVPKPET